MRSGECRRIGKASRTRQTHHNFDLRFVSGGLTWPHEYQKRLLAGTTDLVKPLLPQEFRKRPEETLKPVGLGPLPDPRPNGARMVDQAGPH